VWLARATFTPRDTRVHDGPVWRRSPPYVSIFYIIILLFIRPGSDNAAARARVRSHTKLKKWNGRPPRVFCRARVAPAPPVPPCARVRVRTRRPPSPSRSSSTAVVLRTVRARLDTNAPPTRRTCTRRIGRRPGHVSNRQRAAPGPRRRSFRLAKILRAPRSPPRTRHRTAS